jgi:uncharacterized membrane protein YheB (UPF0754 family)
LATTILPLALVVGIAALIGWITNVVAVKMIFRPHRWTRIVGPLGWQGVLPRHADRYAREVAAMIVEDFFSFRDLVLQIDPMVLRDRLQPLFAAAVQKATDRIVTSLPDCSPRGAATS